MWSALDGNDSEASAQACRAEIDSGVGMAVVSARPKAIRMSLTMSRRLKPESYAYVRMNLGHLTSVDPLRPLDVLIASNTGLRSRPNSRATSMASEVASR